MLSVPEHNIDAFAVSLQKGFLTDDQPVQKLSDPYYEPWEELVHDITGLLEDGELIPLVEKLPVLSTDKLKGEMETRRAYVLLSFLTHGYIWGGERPNETLPPQITVPFDEVAERLGLPPGATYASVTLGNWAPKYPGADITDPDNIRMLHTYTGTPDEAWFYIISVAIEAQGAAVVPAMLDCFHAVKTNNYRLVARCLQKLSECIIKCGTILDRMHDGCAPHVFYHQIRRYLAGSKGMANAGLPNGVFYDEGDGKGSWRQYSGGSNAQSSLIQLIDIVLGVEHYASGESKEEKAANKRKQGYILEMRNYMPGPHRDFLEYMGKLSNVREYTMAETTPQLVKDAYCEAVQSLTGFRNKHINIVSRYIVAASKKPAPGTQTGLNIATAVKAPTDKNKEKQELSGTGGTTLMPFLKQTRDETKNAGIIAAH